MGIYSQKDYADYWSGVLEKPPESLAVGHIPCEREGASRPVYDLGINILVYALMREGSVAQKLVSVE